MGVSTADIEIAARDGHIRPMIGSVIRRWPALGAALLFAAACTPRVQEFGPEFSEPRLEPTHLTTVDSKRLPVAVWPVNSEPAAVIVALHGFNDYRNTFDMPGAWWAERGITTYAVDQRGFGDTADRGIWGGAAAMVADASALVDLVRKRHPGKPVYLLGNSMGAAVTLLTLASDNPPDVDGAILVSPAVWGGPGLNPVARASLWLAAHTMPWNVGTGQGLRRWPSDNIEMLRALGRDPLMIRKTRVDAVYGLTNLMGEAQTSARDVEVPMFVLYGGRDEIVPNAPVELMIDSLRAPHRVAFYPDGYHMLLRSLDRETVWRDIRAWIADPNAPLPSGQERAKDIETEAGAGRTRS